MATPKRTQDTGPLNWAEALTRFACQLPDAIPPDWRTVVQIADETGKSRPHTFKLVKQLFKRGLAERRNFRIASGPRVMLVPHYRLKRGEADVYTHGGRGGSLKRPGAAG